MAQSINIMISQIKSQIAVMEQEIQRKNQTDNMRKQFVNNVSHEMKTPLAIISSQAQMLQYLDEEKRRKYCNSIIEETENMSQMINDMISIFSIQSDEEILPVTSADIGDLVRELSKEYRKLFDANHIILKEEYDLNTVAPVNEKMIKQAVSNYITNAIKHSSEKQVVTVRVLSLEDKVRIEVENQGSHINEKYQNKIWDIFYSGNDNETLNGQKSSGLGLYLVKSIAELHDAEYGFDNIENGVRFYLTIKKVQK
jgi:signal transduction histidine kinase